MGKKIKSFHVTGFFFVTGFIAGGIVAVLLFTALVSYRLDAYHQRIGMLESKLMEKQTQLDNLSESINKKRFVLKDVNIHFLTNIDPGDKIVIQKSLIQKFNALIGKEVNNIDTDLLIEIVNNRIMITENYEYKLKLERLTLSSTLNVWVSLQVVESP